ncbi:MAG TPA: RagB/SusD family nutrient uptake outer membrane protein, partial [Niastella sp.]|nr:RagB/SusD family nutrient uptake outer membrane protein [Niastella sp.]
MNYIFTAITLLTFLSCKKGFFNQVPDDQLNIEQVFQRRNLSEEYLANVYNYIKDEAWLAANIAPWAGLSDEGDITYDRVNFNTYPVNIGNWSPSSTYWDNDLYNSFYKGIRSASYFMQHIPQNQELLSEANGEEVIKRWTAEARALRAWLYFNLLRTYGPFVILPEDPIAPDIDPKDTLVTMPRNTYDECVDYIVSELDKAKADLPLHFTTQANQDYGRITQLFCMAVKSRLLLYAASPLYNGNTDYTNFKNNDGKALV